MAGRVALSFSLVSFLEDDKIGELLAWISLVPIAFAIVEIALMVAGPLSVRQRKIAVMIVLGQTINECVNFALKSFLQELRPNGTLKVDWDGDFTSM